MSFIHSKSFRYVKNLIIGVGASIVMLGALYKIQNWEGGDVMITAGLVTEAIIFFILGVLPPEKDYYWEWMLMILMSLRLQRKLLLPSHWMVK